MTAYIGPWITLASAWLRGRSDLVLENVALRQQLAMYEHRRRPQIRDADRLFWVILARLWPRWREALVAVRPETVVRWHRAGWRRYWTWKSRPRRPGRPRIDPEARDLIMRLARENRTWGAVRIQVSCVCSAIRSVPSPCGATGCRPYGDRRPRAGERSCTVTVTRSGRQTSPPCPRSRSPRSTSSSSSPTRVAAS